jgi:hypothetical protein
MRHLRRPYSPHNSHNRCVIDAASSGIAVLLLVAVAAAAEAVR